MDEGDPKSSTPKIIGNVDVARQDDIKRKILNIIDQEFGREISERERELLDLQQRVSSTRKNLYLVKFNVLMKFYKPLEKQLELNYSRKNLLHPAVRKLMDTSLHRELFGSSKKNDDSNTSVNKNLYVSSFSATQQIGNKAPKYVKMEKIQGNIPKQKIQTNNDSIKLLNGPKFKEEIRIIVGNISQWISLKLQEDRCTHKWMVYVRGPRENPDISAYVKKVRFFLHPSYKPNDVIEVERPPFYLTRRGWGEFPIRVQMFFTCLKNRPFSMIHNLKLDKTFSGLQLLGNEVEIKMWIYTNDHEMAIPTINVGSNVTPPLDDQNVTIQHTIKTEESDITTCGSNTLLVKQNDLSTEYLMKDLSSEVPEDENIDIPLDENIFIPFSFPNIIEDHLIRPFLKVNYPEQKRFKSLTDSLNKILSTSGLLKDIESDREVIMTWDFIAIKQLVTLRNNLLPSQMLSQDIHCLPDISHNHGRLILLALRGAITCNSKRDNSFYSTSDLELKIYYNPKQKIVPVGIMENTSDSDVKEPVQIFDSKYNENEYHPYYLKCIIGMFNTCGIYHTVKYLLKNEDINKNIMELPSFSFLLNKRQYKWNIGKQKFAELLWAKQLHSILVQAGLPKREIWKPRLILKWAKFHGYIPSYLMNDEHLNILNEKIIKQDNEERLVMAEVSTSSKCIFPILSDNNLPVKLLNDQKLWHFEVPTTGTARTTPLVPVSVKANSKKLEKKRKLENSRCFSKKVCPDPNKDDDVIKEEISHKLSILNKHETVDKDVSINMTDFNTYSLPVNISTFFDNMKDRIIIDVDTSTANDHDYLQYENSDAGNPSDKQHVYDDELLKIHRYVRMAAYGLGIRWPRLRDSSWGAVEKLIYSATKCFLEELLRTCLCRLEHNKKQRSTRAVEPTDVIYAIQEVNKFDFLLNSGLGCDSYDN